MLPKAHPRRISSAPQADSRNTIRRGLQEYHYSVLRAGSRPGTQFVVGFVLFLKAKHDSKPLIPKPRLHTVAALILSGFKSKIQDVKSLQ